jgi:hypothetical protein
MANTVDNCGIPFTVRRGKASNLDERRRPTSRKAFASSGPWAVLVAWCDGIYAALCFVGRFIRERTGRRGWVGRDAVEGDGNGDGNGEGNCGDGVVEG